MSETVGMRVAAMVSREGDTVNFLGFGVYEGEFPPPYVPFPNPRIKLDSGEVVYGMECWWGEAERAKTEWLGEGATVVMMAVNRDAAGIPHFAEVVRQ